MVRSKELFYGEREIDKMDKKINYTINEIQNTMGELSNIFDIVRLVNPILGKEYIFREDRLVGSQHNCFAVWDKDLPCRNCSSSRAFHEKSRSTKFEFFNDDIYTIVSKYIEVDGVGMILEIVSNVSKNLLLGTDDRDLIKEITTYNKALYIDPLSGIANRRCFDEESELLFKKALKSHQRISLVIVDIDEFKHVNDQYGHLVGDTAIKAVAATLRSKCRSSSDILARFGGDEFIMMLMDIPEAMLKHRLEEVLEEIRHVHYDDGVLEISVSIGAALEKEPSGYRLEDIIKAADRALYEAKNNGKGQLNCVYL